MHPTINEIISCVSLSHKMRLSSCEGNGIHEGKSSPISAESWRRQACDIDRQKGSASKVQTETLHKSTCWVHSSISEAIWKSIMASTNLEFTPCFRSKTNSDTPVKTATVSSIRQELWRILVRTWRAAHRQGTAQVFRADMSLLHTDDSVSCFVVVLANSQFRIFRFSFCNSI